MNKTKHCEHSTKLTGQCTKCGEYPYNPVNKITIKQTWNIEIECDGKKQYIGKCIASRKEIEDALPFSTIHGNLVTIWARSDDWSEMSQRQKDSYIGIIPKG